jgi:hypothetical protein
LINCAAGLEMTHSSPISIMSEEWSSVASAGEEATQGRLENSLKLSRLSLTNIRIAAVAIFIVKSQFGWLAKLSRLNCVKQSV